jgi:hypothetical protein
MKSGMKMAKTNSPSLERPSKDTYTSVLFLTPAPLNRRSAKTDSFLKNTHQYYNRFANHEQSLRLDKELHVKTEKKMEEIQHASNLSWIEVQFLNKAVETLSVCRTTLKWTYAMAFYLEKNNFTALFEDNQRSVHINLIPTASVFGLLTRLVPRSCL